MKIKEHCGKYQEHDILPLLDKTRLNEQNRKIVIDYLCSGYRIRDFPVRKQQAWNRIKKIVEMLEDES